MKGISLYRVVLAGLVAAVVAPGVLVAQDAATVTAAPVVVAPAVEMAPVAGPQVVQAGVTRAEAAPTTEFNFQNTASRRDVTWMIVGGATLVVGSMVGGDAGTILMVTGGVIGLIGLWRYLQYS
ncbi:MAG: hypothetical protein WD771_11400 [Gemmatimonadaceae bacterium]